MAKTFTLQSIIDELQSSRDKTALDQAWEVTEAALLRYGSQKAYNDADNVRWLRLAKLVAKKYSEIPSETAEILSKIQNDHIGREAVVNSRQKNRAIGLESLQALIDNKAQAENPAAERTKIADFRFSPDDTIETETKVEAAAGETSEITEAAIPEAAAVTENAVNNPPAENRRTKLRISEIKALAAEDFAEAEKYAFASEEAKNLRRKGNKKITGACEAFVLSNNIGEEEMAAMNSRELSFLYQNLRFSNNPQIQKLFPALELECDNRLSDLLDKMDQSEKISRMDLEASLDFSRSRCAIIRHKKVKNINDDDEIRALEESAQKFREELAAIRKAKAEKRQQKAQGRKTEAVEAEPAATDFVINQTEVAARRELPRVPRKEIDLLAKPIFEEADKLPKGSDEYKDKRLEANRAVTQGCLKYIADNKINSDADWALVPTGDLVYLRRNLRFEPIGKKVNALCEERLKSAVVQIKASSELPKSEIRALKDFCNDQIRLLEARKNLKEDEITKLGSYRADLAALKRARTAAPAEQEEKTETNERPAAINPPATAAGHHELSQVFENVCAKKQIRYDKTQTAAAVEYALYPPRAAADAEPNGKLSINSENNITLQSDEFRHFVALTQTARTCGKTEITVGKLSEDPTEAKKFVAMLVLAGYVSNVTINHKFAPEELAQVNPEIKKMQNIIRYEAEINKLQNQAQRAEGDAAKAARTALRAKREEKTQFYIENGGIYDCSSKEERQKIVEEKRQKFSKLHGRQRSVARPPRQRD